jgi:purine-binding chemotaxis protein CheW
VLSTGKGQVGLIVDEVPGVLRVPADAIDPTPEFVKGLAGRFVAGTARDRDRLIILLNVDELLDSKERIALDKLLEELESNAEGVRSGAARKKKASKSRGGRKKKADR